jgi:hypothetical protein
VLCETAGRWIELLEPSFLLNAWVDPDSVYIGPEIPEYDGPGSKVQKNQGQRAEAPHDDDPSPELKTVEVESSGPSPGLLGEWIHIPTQLMRAVWRSFFSFPMVRLAGHARLIRWTST